MQQTQYIAAWKSSTAVRWRGLSWSEYRRFTEQMTIDRPMEVYLDLYRAVLLEGPPAELATAGVVSFIGRSMLETNPFGGRYDDIAHALTVKRNTQTYLDNARALVAGIFRYTFEEIDTWDADIFFDRVAKAEFLAGKTIEPIDPKEVAKQKEAAKTPPKPQRPKKQLTPGQQVALERVQAQQR